METKVSRGAQVFRRVEAWFVSHPEVVAATGAGADALAKQLDALKGVIDRIAANAAAFGREDGQTTLTATDEKALRKELRTVHMHAIVDTAAGLRGQVPGVGVIHMPPANLGAVKLVDAAKSLHDVAATYEQVFVQNGLPQDFLAQLATSTNAVQASIDARGVAKSNRALARENLRTDLDLGRRILKLIDATLTHALKNDPAMLTSWRQTKRVGAKPGARSGGDTTPAPAPVAPAATTSGTTAPTAHPTPTSPEIKAS